MSNSNGTRWWENYLVRYLVPSIAGMFILMWFNQHIKINGDEVLINSLDIFRVSEYRIWGANVSVGKQGIIEAYLPMLKFSSADKFNTASLIGWLLFGTLYCYIASYPVLAIHAIRHLFVYDKKADNEKITKSTNICYDNFFMPIAMAVFIIISLIFILKLCGLEFSNMTINGFIFIFVLPILFSCIFGYQLYKSFEGYKAHLVALAKKRGEKDNTIIKEFTESYKHLREHGNTALILLWEILLAIIIWHTLNLEIKQEILPFSLVSFVVCIWVFPAALVYFYAHRLEGVVVRGELEEKRIWVDVDRKK